MKEPPFDASSVQEMIEKVNAIELSAAQEQATILAKDKEKDDEVIDIEPAGSTKQTEDS